MKETDSDRTWLALLIVLVVAAAVRYWGLDFGLPHLWARPDESRIVNMAVKFGQGDLEPPFFNYPTLYSYLLSIVFGLYYVIGRLFGAYGSLHEFAVDFAADPSRFYLLDRVLAATLGTLTVLVVFSIARRLASKRAAVIASIFLSLAFLHVRDSHFGVTDVPMVFFIMASTLYIMRASDTGRLRDYVLAGLLGGAAASTKYAGFLMVAPMLAAHVKSVQQTGGRFYRMILDRRPTVFIAAMAVTFLAGTPYAALRFSKFTADLASEMSHLDAGHLGVILDIGWWHHLRVNLFYGLGWPLLAISLIGIVILFRANYKKALVFLAFPCLYYLWVGKGYTVFARYILPVIPFLCITAAVAIEHLSGRILRKLSPKVATVVVWALVIIILLPSLYRIWSVNTLLSRIDNRVIAAEWVIDNVPRGSSIYQVNAGIHALQLDPGQFFLERFARYRDLVRDDITDGQPKGSVSVIADSLAAARRYHQWLYDPDEGDFLFDGSVQNSLPQYIITERVPLKESNSVPPEISHLLAESYQPAAEFVAFDSTARNVYDWQDHFYVPLAGFEGVQRPGPNLYVYRLNEQSETLPDSTEQMQ